MLEYSFSRLAGQPELPETNMAVECFLLHYRNLIEFFSGAKHRKGSDISVADPGVWGRRTLTPAELNSLQTPAQTVMITGLISPSFYSTALDADIRNSRNGISKR